MANHTFLRFPMGRGRKVVVQAVSALVRHVVPPLLPYVARLPQGALRRGARSASGDRPHVTILLLHAYGMGGTIRTALTLAGNLASRYEVEVLSVFRWKTTPFFPFPAAVKVTVLDDTYVPHGPVWRVARRVLRNHRSTLINTQDWGYQYVSLWTDLLIMNHLRGMRGVLIGTRPGLNIVAARHAPRGVRIIGQEHMNLSVHRPILRKDIKAFYPLLDAVVVLTEADLRDYRDSFSAKRPRLVQIPNAVPVLDGGQSDPSAKVVVAAGRLTTQKGFDRLIRAWQPVAEAHPDWCLRIYGKGPERDRLEALATRSGVDRSVSLMGETDQVGQAFAAASIFALSSRREGLPMVILEAMSKGLPVVSFKCPTGPAEIVATDHNGVLVPDGDIGAFTSALLAVISDSELRACLAKGALETSRRYDGEVIAGAWTELLESQLARPVTGQRGGR